MRTKISLLSLGLFAPFFAFAQTGSLMSILILALRITSALGTIFGMLAVAAFFYGLARFILAAGDPKKIVEGKNAMIYGIIALFVLVSIVGIISFFQRSLGTDTYTPAVQIYLPRV